MKASQAIRHPVWKSWSFMTLTNTNISVDIAAKMLKNIPSGDSKKRYAMGLISLGNSGE